MFPQLHDTGSWHRPYVRAKKERARLLSKRARIKVVPYRMGRVSADMNP